MITECKARHQEVEKECQVIKEAMVDQCSERALQLQDRLSKIDNLETESKIISKQLISDTNKVCKETEAKANKLCTQKLEQAASEAKNIIKTAEEVYEKKLRDLTELL